MHTSDTHSRAQPNRARKSTAVASDCSEMRRALQPGQWSELAHRVFAASAGSSVVVGHIDG
ncbi:unnamed protein product, partial [Lampetra planeri]